MSDEGSLGAAPTTVSEPEVHPASDWAAQCRAERATIAAVLSTLDIRALIVRGLEELDTFAFRPLAATHYPNGGVIHSTDAVKYFLTCLSAGERHLAQHASRYSQTRWLWYLRHLPPEAFSIVDRKEAVRGRHLAETLATRYGLLDEEVERPFLVNDSSLKCVLRFLGMVLHLDSLTGHLQWCGTDTSFRFKGRPIPDPEPATEVKAAVDSFLVREAREELDFSGLGSFLTVDNVKAGELGILLVFERSNPEIVDTSRYLLNKRQAQVWSFFEPRRVSLSPVLELLDSNSLGEATLLPGFYAAACILSLGLIAFHASDGAAEAILDHGFVVLDRQSAENLCVQGLPRFNALCSSLPQTVPRATSLDDLAHLVREAGADIRRLRPGPMLISARGKVILDIASATQRLFVDAEFPLDRTTDSSHRSRAFELATQRVIDETDWMPPQEFREFRGRTLKRGGSAITDIDAIGVRKGELLLVSCKSIPYDARVDVG